MWSYVNLLWIIIIQLTCCRPHSGRLSASVYLHSLTSVCAFISCSHENYSLVFFSFNDCRCFVHFINCRLMNLHCTATACVLCVCTLNVPSCTCVSPTPFLFQFLSLHNHSFLSENQKLKVKVDWSFTVSSWINMCVCVCVCSYEVRLAYPVNACQLPAV